MSAATGRWVLVPTLLAAACAGGEQASTPAEPALPDVLVVTVPGSSDLPGGTELRLPEGARLRRVPPPGVEAAGDLAAGFAAAGSPAVSFDGTRILFSGRRDSADEDSIWETGAAGGEAQAVFRRPGGCGGPCWLPDGRVVFQAVPGESVEEGPSAALFVGDPVSGEAGRITFFEDGRDRDPTVLPDGRILFIHDEPVGGRSLLMTVHVDGTGIHGYLTTGTGVPSRPRAVAGRAVLFVDGAPGVLRRIDARRPFHGCIAVDGLPCDTVLSVEPLAGDRLLLLGRARGGEHAQLWTVGVDGGRATPLAGVPQGRLLEAVPLAARARPQGHLSLVRESDTTGRLLGVDARHGPDRTTDAALARARSVRLYASSRVLGDLPLAADGSFFAEVPADRTLRLVTLAADGTVLSDSGPRFWLRPNETRACLGCHENPGETPPNVVPDAVLAEPVLLATPNATVGER